MRVEIETDRLILKNIKELLIESLLICIMFKDSIIYCDLCIKVTLNGIHYQGICLMA